MTDPDEFDRHASTYRDEVARSIRFVRRSHDFFAQRKAEYLVELTRCHVAPTETCSVLDVGCGVGVLEPFLIPEFGSVDGLDIAANAVARAAAGFPAAMFTAYDGGRFPYADDTFHVAFAACVVHHVDDEDRPAFVAEMRRVVRADGLVVVFEHNPFNPLTRFAVGRCEFDEGAHLLTRRTTERLLAATGLVKIESAYIITHTSTAPRLRDLERALRRVPLGAQYYAAFGKSLRQPNAAKITSGESGV
jgi:SAM-dependent methyltransferase